jgi:hypothetical protein
MAQESGRFQTHHTRGSIAKRSGIGGLIVLLIVLGIGGGAFTVREPVLSDRVAHRDPLAIPCAYVLGLRGVKAEKTGTVLCEALDARSGDKPAAPGLRAAAAFALGTLQTHEAVITVFEACTKDTDPNVRAAACKSMGKMGDSTRGFPALAGGLDDLNATVRAGACEGAGSLKDQRLVHRLVDLVNDDEFAVRSAATKALHAITGVQIGIDAVAWKSWYEANQK